MKRVVYDQEERCIDFAAEKIGIEDFGAFAHAIGLLDGDEMIAATIWTDFTPYNCMQHIASDGSRRWMTREFLFRSFAYPFLQLELPRISGIIRADNERSLNLALHCGLQIEAPCIRRYFGDVDGVGVGLLKEDCRFIRPDFFCKIHALAA